MTTLLDSATATGASATEGDVKSLLTNLRDYIAGTLGTDTANKGAIAGLLNLLLGGRVAKTGAFTLGAAERGQVMDCSGTWVMTLTAAATLGDNFTFAVRNSGTGAITIDPNLAEQIQGQTSVVISSGEFVIIYCDGVAFNLVGGSSLPAGSMVPYGGTAAPAGYLLCYGQVISRTNYSALFLAIGTTYGVGDGSTTFGLPDLRGRVVAGKDNMGGTAASRLTSAVAGSTLGAVGGAQTHTLSSAEMPAHTHTVTSEFGHSGFGGLAGYPEGSVGAPSSITSSSAGSGGAHNNVQPTIALNYLIKT